ncbi:hypothetical protein BUALT_Bualt06G0036800 [Buddleja alternifolia]|uniref:Uncharacterized protein n=1 Tax=Buddleja alternifolia TaxID=168488 RepID=A0AAV6XNK5_9LAMI|nr:hypothetical protein BUALT_Bualt06G0036800 [Buddleja alternifolia]
MEPSISIPAICGRIIQKQMAELQKQSFVDGMEFQYRDTEMFLLNLPSKPIFLMMDFLQLLDSSRLMLIEPNLEEAHPDVADTAEMYKNDRAMYESTTQSWTQLYAMEENAQ